MFDSALRPDSWDTYVGQADLKHRLDIHITAALATGEPLPHILFIAPPGYGKTTLARIIATRMCEPFQVIDEPLSRAELRNTIYSMGEGIILLDEIHRWPKATQEDLRPVIEDRYLMTTGGVRLPVPDLTVIAATTEREKIIKPLYDRFVASVTPPFADYSDEELQTIVSGMATRAGVELDEETTMVLGRASGGTPRLARQFILAARHRALADEPVTAGDILAHCQVQADGLTKDHVDYMHTLQTLGGVRGVGLSQISAMVRLNDSVIRDLERLLFTRGLVIPTPSGRMLTEIGMARIRRGVRAA